MLMLLLPACSVSRHEAAGLGVLTTLVSLLEDDNAAVKVASANLSTTLLTLLSLLLLQPCVLVLAVCHSARLLAWVC
jgi:hypothetical protein